MAVSSVLNTGSSALNASSAWINVTGNNIANVNTEGYSRQYVVQEDAFALNTRPGAQGQGVNAKVVLRYYDEFLGKAYLEQNSTSSRWEEQKTNMSSLENLFNEANRIGVSSNLTEFFTAWKTLALRPDDTATRQSLVSYTENLTDMIRNMKSNIQNIQYGMDQNIAEDVNRINEITQSLADINRQIAQTRVEGINEPNSLYDKRNLLTLELSQYIDVTIVNKGGQDFTVLTKSGKPLVDRSVVYPLQLQAPQAEGQAASGSNYAGNITFSGNDAFEYTVEIVRGGDAGDNPPPAFRVSLDGGKSWLLRPDGTQEFTLTDGDGNGAVDPVTVKNLEISFTSTTDFFAGDRFYIVPKTGLYWVEPTRGPENITPQIYPSGVDNIDRVTGGSLASSFNIRDDNCGRYMDELDALANALIWEVNRLHSQGSGTGKMTGAQGTYNVRDENAPLGSAQSGLAYAGKLQQGNITFCLYDSTTDVFRREFILDFDPNTDGVQNFDPQRHSLTDVMAAVNRSSGGQLTARIQDGRIQISTAAGVSFSQKIDSAGLLAGLGINTFFEGGDAAGISLNSVVRMDPAAICAGAVNGNYEVNEGDASVAQLIADLSEKKVAISTGWKNVTGQSLTQYYNALVGTVGSDTRTANTNETYHKALTGDLKARVQASSGVNLDEEMSNLIKHQASYKAAAKLITTADEMLQIILGLKE